MLAQLLSVLVVGMFGHGVALLLGVDVLLLTIIILGGGSRSHCLKVLWCHIRAPGAIGALKVVEA